VCVCECVCMCVHACVCVCVRTRDLLDGVANLGRELLHVPTELIPHLRVCVCVCVCVCECVCVCVYVCLCVCVCVFVPCRSLPSLLPSAPPRPPRTHWRLSQ
jgi:hypothetical protein